MDNQNNLDFTEIKKKLFKLNINYLLVEGGKELTKSLIQKKEINQFFLFKSGKKLNKVIDLTKSEFLQSDFYFLKHFACYQKIRESNLKT